MYQEFTEQYEIIRRDEGWGRDESSYYRQLPAVPADDSNREIWSIRRRTFRALMRCVVEPMERATPEPLIVADLGAGCGWLAHRLALRGARVAAVDLRTDRYDGLGAYVYYDAAFVAVQSDFDCLPFASGQFDLAVFNGSFHYSTAFEATIAEALRVLRANGRLVVLDSPLCASRESGLMMVQRREHRHLLRFGFASNALSSEGFLTPERLREIGAAVNVEWTLYRPPVGIRPALRRAVGRVLGRATPPAFPVITADKVSRNASEASRIEALRRREQSSRGTPA